MFETHMIVTVKMKYKSATCVYLWMICLKHTQ